MVETARLRLREWTDADIEPWAQMNADARVMEFFPSPIEPEASRAKVAIIQSELRSRGYGWFVMERKNEPGFAGVLVVDDVRYDVPYQPRREIGWRLPVACWGHGYASEGAAALLEYAFGTLGWPHIVAMTALVNVRSQRVMQRIGMTRDPTEDFQHPRLAAGHRLAHHILYRKSAPFAVDCPRCSGTSLREVDRGRRCQHCGLKF